MSEEISGAQTLGPDGSRINKGPRAEVLNQEVDKAARLFNKLWNDLNRDPVWSFKMPLGEFALMRAISWD